MLVNAGCSFGSNKRFSDLPKHGYPRWRELGLLLEDFLPLSGATFTFFFLSLILSHCPSLSPYLYTLSQQINAGPRHLKVAVTSSLPLHVVSVTHSYHTFTPTAWDTVVVSRSLMQPGGQQRYCSQRYTVSPIKNLAVMITVFKSTDCCNLQTKLAEKSFCCIGSD